MVFAVATGSAPPLVGASVAPNAETMTLTPAALYSDLIAAFLSPLRAAHAAAWSAGPETKRKERTLQEISSALRSPRSSLDVHHSVSLGKRTR